MIPKRVLYYGKDEPLPEKVEVRAGPFTAVFTEGDLRWITFRSGHVEREAVRRIYVSVRDRNWGTVTPVLRDVEIECGAEELTITYLAVHKRGDIHFEWRGSITGEKDGTILFEMDGEAKSTFLRNRIGFCVLHPTESCAGQPCTIEKVDGAVERGTFPELIAPHQPFKDIRGITSPLSQIRFEGDVFEMEDQRNWSDASYKTYCTPLALPFPAEVKAGTKIRQSVRVNPRAAALFASRESGSRLIRSASQSPLPPIGFGASPVDETELKRLQALKPAHIRCTPALARDYGCPLEVEVTAPDWPAIKQRVARWLVFDPNGKSTAADTIKAARQQLKGAHIVAGTNAFFTELNRGRPDPSIIDGACFSLNPQVHAFDNDSLVENLAAQADVVHSARAFLAGKPVHVTPVTLRMRANSDPTVPGSQPDSSDPRQKSLFGAAWTVGSIKYLSEHPARHPGPGGAASLTYYTIAGPTGLMEGGSVFPMYHVFADVAEFAGGGVVTCTSTLPLEFDALVLKKGRRTRILLASFSPEPQSVRVDVTDMGRTLLLKSLDETNAERAMKQPESFRAEPATPLEITGHEIEITLRPYAIFRIDNKENS
ncbi:MAG TPA: hypothetical protein VN428_06495 [Bryobacteraceae bacterium]|nr:hypothetical protein [Bryobacteraceae bacterium]